MKTKALINTGLFWAMIFIAGCSTVISDKTYDTPLPATSETAKLPAVQEPEVETSSGRAREATDASATKATASPDTEQPVTVLEIPKPENQLGDGEYRWSQLLSRDSILPIYQPEFVNADDAPYDDDELVIGVALDGEAKAYAIGPLNRREMVNDELAGIPILVTW